jgi:predicted aspartyl protease
MDGTSPIVEILCNKEILVPALLDTGCDCFAAISDKFARKLRSPRFPIKPRGLGEAASQSLHAISELTYVDADIDGFRQRIFCYVVPGLRQELILGDPWMKRNDVVVFSKKSYITIGAARGLRVPTERQGRRDQRRRGLRIRQTSASVFLAQVRAARRRGTPTQVPQVFKLTLEEIDRALTVKPQEPPAPPLPPEVQEFAHLFDKAVSDQLPPHRPGVDHHIELEKDLQGQDRPAPWGPLYGMSRGELLVLRKTLTELLDKSYIRASNSPAGAPVLFVRKADGSLRFCCDYRGLNAVTKRDRYPLPLITETLRNLSGARWFTKLDVRAAFHKIRIQEGDEWKTAFRTRFGSFEWLVTPFGLSGAPATFQRYVNQVLREFLDIFCTAYIDDVLVYTDGSRKDHMDKVRSVLQRLSEAGLGLDPKKCEFAVTTTKYLGFIIDAGQSVRMDPEKVRAIREWEAPTNVRGVRSFLGFANFYRQFIAQYSELTGVLTKLTRKGAPFRWGPEETRAFEALKEAFISEPALAQWDPSRETLVETDCSGWALGGCLSQVGEDGILRAVGYHSRRLSPAECNYDIHDKELLAVVSSIGAWDSELRSLESSFTILTDHKNLEYFRSTRRLTERQVRWSETLARHHFTLRYRPGSLSLRPDALSRREQDVPQEADPRYTGRDRQLIPDTWIDAAAETTPAEPGTTQLRPLETSNTPVLPKGSDIFREEDLQQLWEAALQNDPSYQEIFLAVLRGDRSFPPHLSLRISISECRIDVFNRLQFRDRTFLPDWEPLQTAVIQRIHDSYATGHPGRDVTQALVARQYFWPDFSRMVRRFCRNCDVCGFKGVWRDRRRGFLKPLPIPDRLRQELSIDFMTNLPQKAAGAPGFLMVITDRLGKDVVLEAMTTMEAEACAERFTSCWWRYHGFPRAITSDRGSNWVGAFWRRLCELVRIDQRLSTAYHPETDGATERANQEVLAYLRAFVAYSQDDWPELLPGAMFAINNRDSSAIGMSPFFLSHGYHADVIQEPERSVAPEASPKARAERLIRRLKEATEFAQAAMASAQDRQETQANRTRQQSERFKEGDEVWLSLRNIPSDRSSRKLDWLHAKYRVLEVIGSHNVRLNVPGGVHPVFHVDLLRRAADDPLPSQVRHEPQPPAALTDPERPEEDEWEVREISDTRRKARGRELVPEVLVYWTGYQAPTWEPLSNLEGTAAWDKFLQRHPGQSDPRSWREVRRRRGPRGPAL